MTDHDGQADREKKNEEAEESGHRPSFQELRGARQHRGQQSISALHAALMLSDFLELLALRGDRDAVALEIDVDALRAIGGAFARRLAAGAECAAALDARTCEACAPSLEEDQRRQND